MAALDVPLDAHEGDGAPEQGLEAVEDHVGLQAGEPAELGEVLGADLVGEKYHRLGPLFV